MEKKNLDWSNLTFSYQKTDKRFVANYTNDRHERRRRRSPVCSDSI